MDLVSGCPFWPLKNGLLGSYPALHENIFCDVAIIGGGITGALAGFRLVEAGLDTVVLDGRDIGFGSTGASTALLQYEADTPLYRLAQRVGEARAIRSYRVCRDALATIAELVRRLPDECGFEPQESLYFASRKRNVPGLRREYAARRSAGFAVEWWDRRRIAAESSFPYTAAILSHTAAQIDAFQFTHLLLQAAARHGLRVYDRTVVSGWRKRGRAFDLRTCHGARVRARKLVIAAGYEAQRYLPRGRTAMHSTYALISEPLGSFPGWPARRLIWETARPYVYLRTTADDRAIIGGYDEPFQDPAARDALLPAKRAALVRRFHQLLPKIPLEVAYTWTGTFAETKDSLPYIGPASADPDLYFALGYGGNGITFGVVAADIIRDLVLGRANPHADLFRFDRIHRSPDR